MEGRGRRKGGGGEEVGGGRGGGGGGGGGYREATFYVSCLSLLGSNRQEVKKIP